MSILAAFIVDSDSEAAGQHETQSGDAMMCFMLSDESPTASIEPQQQTVKQGSDVTIDCVVTGSPAPAVRWSKVRSELGPNQRVSNCLSKM